MEFDGDAGTTETDGAPQYILGDRLFLADLDEAEAIGDLASDEEIAPQRLLLRQGAILVDGLDREVMGHADGVVGDIDFAVANVDAAGRRLEHSGHDLDQGRLAGAIVTDQADDLVASDGEIDVAQRLHRSEKLLNAFEADNRREILRSSAGLACGIVVHFSFC